MQIAWIVHDFSETIKMFFVNFPIAARSDSEDDDTYTLHDPESSWKLLNAPLFFSSGNDFLNKMLWFLIEIWPKVNKNRRSSFEIVSLSIRCSGPQPAAKPKQEFWYELPKFKKPFFKLMCPRKASGQWQQEWPKGEWWYFFSYRLHLLQQISISFNICYSDAVSML